MAYFYGAQQNGLICGFRFTLTEAAQPIDLPQAIEWVKSPPSEDVDSFIWLHFDLTDGSVQTWMRDHLQLAEEFFEVLQQGSRSTRIEDTQDSLVAVVNNVAYEFAFDPSEIATLWLSVSRQVAVSARAHPSRSIDRLREAVKQGVRFASSVDLLNHLMKDQGDVLV
jgi:zinc transporter